MKTIRVRLANTVLAFAAAGLAFTGSLAGHAQSDDRGSSAGSFSEATPAAASNKEVAAARDMTVTHKLQSMFAKHQNAALQQASADASGEPVIQLAGNEVEQKLAPEPNPTVVRQSDILQHLQELYEKDGREMPPMSLDQAPNTSGSVPEPPARQQTNTQQQPQQQQQPVSNAAPEKKKPSLLRRLFNRSSKSENAGAKNQSKGRNDAKSRNQTMRSAPATQTRQAAPAAHPQQAAQHPGQLENENVEAATPQVQQATTVDDSRKVNLATPSDVTEQKEQAWKPSASPAERAGVETPMILDEFVPPEQHAAQPATPAATPAAVAPAAPQSIAPANVAPANPAPANTAQAAPQEANGQDEAGQPETNPFTGLKLEEEKPAVIRIPASTPAAPTATPPAVVDEFTQPAAPQSQAPVVNHADSAKQPAELPTNSAPATQSADQSVEAKLHRIVERSGKPGLKGFCVVALRDERDLLDSQPEFQATFEGKSYFFSSAKAKAKFQQNPRKYVPVAGGADVVVLAHNNQTVPGTLEHALWFRERLYLFSTAESRDTFVNNPQQYVDAASNAVAE